MYKTITNNPIERHQVTYPWTYWDNIFTDDELKKMCDYFDTQGVERSTTVGADGSQNVDEEIRVSNLRFYSYDLKNENTSWIFQRINQMIELANNTYYNFDLNGYSFFQYTEYDASEKGRYDFHTDTIFGQGLAIDMVEPRKLSVTVCINEPGTEYEGGEFQINMGNQDKPVTVETKKGRMIIFPSFMIHRVAPVIKGKRKSLVVWVTGPKFK
jgi:PKHD-type hydroxylase